VPELIMGIRFPGPIQTVPLPIMVPEPVAVPHPTATPEPEKVPMPSIVPQPIAVPVPVRVPDDVTGKNPPTRAVPTPLTVPVPIAVPQPSTWGTLRVDISGYLDNEEEAAEELIDDEGPSVMVIVELEITSTDVMVDDISELLPDELCKVLLDDRPDVED
jgi:hypothetical protein